jgi:hypothetical protein
MRKIIIVGIVGWIIYAGINFYSKRKNTKFWVVNGKIKKESNIKFYEERYKDEKNGFKVEKGNLFIWSEEVFKKGAYIYRLKFLGISIKYRRVDYSFPDKELCWGIPGVPFVDWQKGWFNVGRKRFRECIKKIEEYEKKYPSKKK